MDPLIEFSPYRKLRMPEVGRSRIANVRSGTCGYGGAGASRELRTILGCCHIQRPDRSGFQIGGICLLHQVRGADGRRRPVDVGDFVKAGTVLASVRAGEYLKTTNSGYSLVAQPAAERLYRSY